MVDKAPFYLHSQYQGFWWPGYEKLKVIKFHGVIPVLWKIAILAP